MKTLVKSLFIVMISTILFSNSTRAQVTLDCESGNRNIDAAACWGFGALSYTSTSNLVIAGLWSARSNQLTNLSPDACWLKTPWMLVGNGDITFLTKLDGGPATTRALKLFYIPYDINSSSSHKEGVPVEFFHYDFPSATSTVLRTISVAVPAAIMNSTQPYKIKISYIGTGGTGRALSDNFSFPGTYYSDPTNSCLPLVVIQDTDNDGVADADDAYPNDPYRAYNNYYPSASTMGTLAFEDNWPSKGDFDFNDLVVDYRLNTVTNAQNQIVEVLGTYKLRASGASFRNGFGLQLDGIANNKVISATGHHAGASSIITYAANGTEANQQYVNQIVFDNFYSLMPHPGAGALGINTDENAAFVPHVTLNTTITFMNSGVAAAGGPVNISQLPPSAFNFYIISKQDRGREVHLADYSPTSLANTSLFGTSQDDTNPAIGKYYKTVNNLPWAINVLQGFDYPKEKMPIDEAYLHFVEWAQSAGSIYADWFSNQAGYRNAALIY